MLLSNQQTLRLFNMFPLVLHWIPSICHISQQISLNTSWILTLPSKSQSQQKLWLNDSIVHNPYSNNQGFAAFLPGTSWGPGSDPNLPDPVKVTESQILSIQVLKVPLAYGPTCNSSFSASYIPSSVNFYLTLTTNSTYYSCFTFANVTYTAGGAICQGGMIVSPAIVEGNIIRKNVKWKYQVMAKKFSEFP